MIAVPFIYFTCLSLFLWRKHKAFDISAYIAIVYAISAFFSILIDVFNIYGINGVCDKIPLNVLPTFAYCFLLTLCILPFSAFRSTDIKLISIDKEWLFNIICYVFIGTFIVTLLSNILDIQLILQSDLQEVRGTVYADEQAERPTGIRYVLALPATLFSQYSHLALLCFFYSVCFLNKKRLFNYLLLISSSTAILQAIMIAGRTQIVYWLLTFGFCYVLFQPHMDKKKRSFILKPFLILSAVVLLFFMAVTIARWEEKDSAQDSLIIYAGQSYLNFCYFFDSYTAQQITFERLFPFIHYFFLNPDFALNDYRDLIWSQSGMNIGVFYTFLGDLLVDLGHVGMLVYVCLYFIFGMFLLRRRDYTQLRFYQLLILLVLALIPLQGLFYYSYHRVDCSYYVIGTLILSILFKYTFKYK